MRQNPLVVPVVADIAVSGARRNLSPTVPQKTLGNPHATFEQQVAGQHQVVDDTLRLLDVPQAHHEALTRYPG